MSRSTRHRALGRGLSALLPGAGSPTNEPDARRDAPVDDADPATPGPARPTLAKPRPREYFHAQVENLYPSPDQPRRRFDDAELDELAQSIRTHGVIQPVVVRTRTEGGYFLIAGERRWRAAQRAGLQELPVVVQEVAPRQAFERALVENVQRADLNPIEEAEAYRRLVDEFEYTQEQVAERVGKERSTVTNSLRLLRLPDKVRRMVEEGGLSHGHAKALLSLDSDGDIETVARTVSGKKLSVRATEALVKKRKRAPAAAEAPATGAKKSASVRDLEHRLTRSLGAQVAIEEAKQGKGGRISISYIDLDDLDRLLARLIS